MPAGILPPLEGEIALEFNDASAFAEVMRGAEQSRRAIDQMGASAEQLERRLRQMESSNLGNIFASMTTRMRGRSGDQSNVNLPWFYGVEGDPLENWRLLQTDMGVLDSAIAAKREEIIDRDLASLREWSPELLETEAMDYLYEQAFAELFNELKAAYTAEMEGLRTRLAASSDAQNLAERALRDLDGALGELVNARFDTTIGAFRTASGQTLRDTHVRSEARISDEELKQRAIAASEVFIEGLQRGLTERQAALVDALAARQSLVGQQTGGIFQGAQFAQAAQATQGATSTFDKLIGAYNVFVRYFTIARRIATVVGTVATALKTVSDALGDVEARAKALDELDRKIGDAPRKIAAVQEALRNTVSERDITNALGAISETSVLTAEDMLTGVAEAVRARADEVGGNWKDMMAEAAKAIQTGNGELLEQMGILDNARAVLQAYAAEQGIFVEQLTQLQVQQALANAAIEESADKIDRALTPQERLKQAQQELAAEVVNTKDAFNEWLVAMVAPTHQNALEFWVERTRDLADAVDAAENAMERSARNRRAYAAAESQEIKAVINALNDAIAAQDRERKRLERQQSVASLFGIDMDVDRDIAEAKRMGERYRAALEEIQRQVIETGTFDKSILDQFSLFAPGGPLAHLVEDIESLDERQADQLKAAADELRKAQIEHDLATLLPGGPGATGALTPEQQAEADRMQQSASLALELAQAKYDLAEAEIKLSEARRAGDEDAAAEAEAQRNLAQATLDLAAAKISLSEAELAVNSAQEAVAALAADATAQERAATEAALGRALAAQDEAVATYLAAHAALQKAQADQAAASAATQATEAEQAQAEATDDLSFSFTRLNDQAGVMIDTITGLPLAFDLAAAAMKNGEVDAKLLKEALLELDEAFRRVGQSAIAHSYSIGLGFTPYLGFQGGLEKGAEFARQQRELYNTFQEINQEIVAAGRAPLDDQAFQIFSSELTRRQQAELAEMGRLGDQVADTMEDVGERINQALENVIEGVLQPTTGGLIDLDELLPHDDTVDERARRMADVAVKGFQSPWYEGLKAMFPEEVLAEGEDKVKEAAARMVRDHQQGLTTVFYDTELAAQKVIQRLLANQEQDKLIEDVRERVKELAGDVDDLDLKEALGIDTTPERTARAIRSALEGTLPFEQIMQQMTEILTGQDSPFIKALEMDAEEEEKVKGKGAVAAIAAGQGFTKQMEDGKYGAAAVGELKAKLSDDEARTAMQNTGKQLAIWMGDQMVATFSENVPKGLLDILTAELIPLMEAALRGADERTAGSS